MSLFPEGFAHLPAHLAAGRQVAVLAAVREVIAKSPLYTPTMPRTGKSFSVAMTNCGMLGWVSDQVGGYRYQATHPTTGTVWPEIPPIILDLWAEVAGFGVPPEACLINYYGPGTKLGSHADTDEQTFDAPVVSVSLGDAAAFHVGGLRRNDAKHRLRLNSGDVVVLAGKSRRAYHGIDRIYPATSALLAEGGRINLTLRRVTAA